MDPDNGEIKKDAERSRKKLLTLVKKQEILLRGERNSTSEQKEYNYWHSDLNLTKCFTYHVYNLTKIT